jgi:hypothetical protein
MKSINRWITIENIIHIIIALLFPVCINLYALLMEVDNATLIASFTGNLYKFGVPNSPWLVIIPSMIIILVILSIILLGIDKTFSLSILTRQKPLLRFGIIIIIALAGSMMLYIGTLLLSYTWLGKFNDYLLGLPASKYILIPAQFIQLPVLFIIFILSGSRR